MERREHYHPEDIESLLHERGFDELLEEERAFVLKHLTGRDEYEAMRALLSHVREDDRRHTPLVADSGVRDHVMGAFRAQQRPQWSIWLNSLGALLWPKEMSATPLWRGRLWRPALAFASLALLIVAGVQVSKYASEGAASAQLADLKEAPAKNMEKDLLPKATPAEEPVPAVALEEEKDQEMERAQNTFSQVENVNTVTSEGFAADEQAAGAVTAEAPPPPVADADQSANAVLDLAAVEKKAEVAASAPASATGTTISHQVTEQELFQNQSVANVGVRTRNEADAERQKVKGNAAVGNLAEEPALLALLNAGW